ncbi:MAG: FAD-dependent oxidoreductase [Sutterella wadsworthensis]|nr:FAD-dependent oxidoreductase [Sutterella wadsworthensis]
MDELIYGVWEGRAYDNRRRLEGEAPEGLPLSEFLSFNNGNPAAGFVGPQGFLMFDNRVTLADVLLNYYRRTKELSCGRCTPCRAGSVLICEALEKACAGEGESVDWDRIQLVAEQMAETSLCGVGLSTPAALLGALKHFPELLRQAPVMPVTRRDFFSVATAPCIEACPANVNVPRYIDYIRDGHPELSTGVLLRHYPLVGSCGRVCVRPCETACARNHVDGAVAIKDLKRYAADHVGSTMADLFKKDEIPDTPVSKRVAVIGAGPAGINCAYHLLRKGHHVDVFEAEDYAGGMARLGIPAYRLPNHLLETETEVIERLGGHYHYNCALGRDYTIDSLFRRGYDAIFLGVGCALGQYLNLPNEDQSAHGYLKGLDFLLAIEHHQSRHEDIELDGDIVVVGCGNVAMDCCRTARRLMKGHRRVTVSYRRTRASAPADPEEITAAIDENIHFEFLTAPVEVMVEEGRVIGLKLIRMQEGEPDASGRRSVKPIAGSEFIVPCRYVIAAIGQKLDDSVFSEADGIKLTKRGTIEVDESLQTSREGVFAGGDAAAGPTSLIWGMAQGQDAANAIHEYLMTHTPGFNARRRMSRLIKEANLLGTCAPERAVVLQPRQVMSHLAPQARVQNWDEVEHGFTDQEAWAEAKRCMRCYRLFGVSTLKPIPGKTASEDL